MYITIDSIFFVYFFETFCHLQLCSNCFSLVLRHFSLRGHVLYIKKNKLSKLVTNLYYVIDIVYIYS